ncbi:MAG: glycoside hydrolase family 3 C-terminal domain-containing protein [Bacteroidales bacterium]|nr:glycoside hydrolase family 3 C-terminal domain-containing protein [Bacteroidales bacterium]
MKTLLRVLAGIAALCAISCTPKPSGSNGPVYLDTHADIEARIDDALSRMTLEEKIKIIHAQSKFSSAGVPRLGIPELWTTDGPHGIRTEVLWDEWEQAGWTNDSIVAFPALTALAATWDRDLSALYGKSIGEEARYREKDVLLGPGVNIYRTPLNGRNFEYMGEDPYLSGQMVVPYVQQVQKNGVAVCVKHFALNNEETFRHTTDVDLDDRALYEIYLPAFKAAVQQGGAWSIMGSYNLYRGQHVCYNERLIMDILKGEWGFDGAVISDWGGVHETDAAVKNGLDLEFGTWTDGLTMGATNGYDAYYLAKPYRDGILSGKYGTEELDEKCRRVLRLIFRTAMNPDKPFGAINSEAHYAAARKIGAEGIVLLKNDRGVLPVAPGVKRILVVGENAVKMMTVGGGSSSLKVQHEISPLDGIRARAGKDVEVVYARGYVGDTGGSYNGVSSGQDLSESRSPEQLIAEAVELAGQSDLVIFIGGLNKSNNQDCEGTDRRSLDLPYDQDAVIEALAAANPNLVVSLVSGNAVAMPWVDKVPAILQTWYLGSEAGNALADVVFGDVNPSGKLPFTFPKQLTDSPAHQPGMTFPNRRKVTYEEGIFVGYRWFDEKDIEPLFAFGHGLSYTQFSYGEAKLDKSSMNENGTVRLTVKVTNTGDREGAEVVQLYIADKESSLPRPEKELKDFQKVLLAPGQSKDVTFTIGADALKFYDPALPGWKAEKGDFEALVGSASDDIRTRAAFTLK